MAEVRELYDQDFNLWVQETAAALRAERWAAVDVEHVAEEIEDMGKRNTARTGKPPHPHPGAFAETAPGQGDDLEYNQRAWQASILRQRAEVESLLRESPSLRRWIDRELIEACYRRAAAFVATEYGVDRPPSAPSSARISSGAESAARRQNITIRQATLRKLAVVSYR